MVLSAFISYTGFAAFIILAIIILLQDRKKTINRLFFVLSICMCFLMLFAHLTYTAETREKVEFFYMASCFFFSYVFAVNLHFNLLVSGHKLKQWQLLIIYFPASVVLFVTFFIYSLFSGFLIYQGGWKFVSVFSSFGFYFYILYTVSYLIASITVLGKFSQRSKVNKEKRQAIIVIFAHVFMAATGPTFAFLLPAFGIYSLSIYSSSSFIIYLLAVYYSVFKLRFFNLTPSVMADEIIANINDMIIVLNTDLTIDLINEPCEKKFNISKESARNKRINILVSEHTGIERIVNELLQSNNKSLYCCVHFIKKDEEIITDSYISKIYDKFNDHAGYLIIARENRGKKHFQGDYKITEREFQIIDMVLSGLPNKTIGERLDISERTVETHRLNVYSKIGISNRIELFKIAWEYNLIFCKK